MVIKKVKKSVILNIFFILCITTFLSSVNVFAEDITLEEILNLGIENNIGIKEWQIDKKKAEIDLDSSKKAFLPEISLSTSYTRTFLNDNGGDSSEGIPNLPPTFGQEIDENIKEYVDGKLYSIEQTVYSIYDAMSAMQPSKDNFQTGITLQQPIYLGGKLRIGKEQAEKGLTVADIQYRQRKNELLFNIIQSYYNVLLAEERVEIEEDALELIQEHKRVAEVSLEAGISLKTDLLQVEIEESKAILSLESACNDLHMARRMLGNLIGADVLDKNFIQPVFELEPKLDNELQYELARKNSSELKLLDINQEVLELNLKMEERSYLPNVVLVGNYQWQDDEFSLKDGAGSITLSANMNIFDKGISNNNENKFKKDLENLAMNKSNIEELIEIGIENLLLSIEENKHMHKLQKMNLDKAKENLELENIRYQVGTGTNMDVMNAQMVLKQTKIAEVQAEYQYQISIYELLEKTGLLGDYYEGGINVEK